MGRTKRFGACPKSQKKGDNPQINIAKTPKHLDRRPVLPENVRKTFIDSILIEIEKNVTQFICYDLCKFLSEMKKSVKHRKRSLISVAC